MRNVATLFFQAVVVLACCVAADAKGQAVKEVPTALQDYVAAKDNSYSWTLVKNDRSDDFLTYDIELTSQVWEGITWKHALTVFIPLNDLRHRDTVLLFIMGGSTGGKPGADDLAMGRRLATNAEMPVALLSQIPNQPLLGD